jgi:hypothetical protein
VISVIRLIPHVQKILDFSPVIRYSDLFLLFGTEEDRHYGIDRWAKLFKTKTWEDLRMITKIMKQCKMLRTPYISSTQTQ